MEEVQKTFTAREKELKAIAADRNADREQRRKDRMNAEKRQRREIVEKALEEFKLAEKREIEKKRAYDDKLMADFERDKANLANKTDRVSLKLRDEQA